MHVDSPRFTHHKFKDRIDMRILNVLRQDGRISNSRLAEQVHLSPSAVYERVQRLRREGYILGYQARLSHEKLGMEAIAFVEVQLELMSSKLMQAFESAVHAHGRILECHMIAGTFDYLLKVLVSDMAACQELVAGQISRLPGVRHARTQAGVEVGEREASSPVSAGPALDAIDRRLLRLLQADGRCGVPQLAAELDLTSAVVRERLEKLCRKGFILGYGAVLDESKLSSGCLVFAAIRTDPTGTGTASALKVAALKHEEIIDSHEVVGNFHHLLKLRVPDLRRHNELMEFAVWPIAGVREVRSYAVIDEVKSTTRIPI